MIKQFRSLNHEIFSGPQTAMEFSLREKVVDDSQLVPNQTFYPIGYNYVAYLLRIYQRLHIKIHLNSLIIIMQSPIFYATHISDRNMHVVIHVLYKLASYAFLSVSNSLTLASGKVRSLIPELSHTEPGRYFTF